MRRRLIILVVLGLVAALPAATAQAEPSAQASYLAGLFEVQTLDGSNNNPFFPSWGKAGTAYTRVAAPRYADGRSQPVSGPNSRYVSNRVFNDINQNIFSEREVSQWGFVWGQFLDHTFGLRLGRTPGDPAGETANIPFNSSDALEDFTNTLGYIPFVRSTPADGTGTSNARQQVNTVSSYIDAFTVYGPNAQRLEWLREGSIDGSATNNLARMMLPGGYLPQRDARGNPSTAPTMEIDGRLRANPTHAVVAGDVRANENIGLTATHTLFAREHNRIVSRLPHFLSQEDKFQIARRIVIAEQQYITYREFLPAMGVNLPAYRGYNPFRNANLSNEFATVGYRAHSQIHGEFEIEAELDRYNQATLDALEAQGVEIAIEGDDVELAVPLNVAFFNPDLLELIQLGPMLQGIGLESQYKNEEQIDNQLRSVLFQIPVPGNPECLDGPTLPECFRGVVDLGAIDIERGRDHGMPSYNQLRRAYGLPAKTSFAAITGEASEAFPPGTGINTRNSLEFTSLTDIDGNPVPIGEDGAINFTRRSPLAARLKAIYGSVDRVDAFTGMVAERHLAGSEFGELQLAIWTKQFAALRDGDRFFYANDHSLSFFRNVFGIDYRVTLAEVIAANTDIPLSDLNENVFLIS